jgi:hypothetical protein
MSLSPEEVLPPCPKTSKHLAVPPLGTSTSHESVWDVVSELVCDHPIDAETPPTGIYIPGIEIENPKLPE